MKTALLYLSGFLLAVTTANTQPVLTTASNALVAEDVFVLQTTKIDGVTKPSTGTGQVWDYSGLVDSAGTRVMHYIDAAGTPYISLFPGANLADTTVSSGTTNYAYITTGDNMTLHGNASPFDTVYFTPPVTIIQFPVSYGYSKYDNVDVSDHHGTIISGKWIQHADVDGYGTLILPGGASYDVLRVTLVDSAGTLFLGNWVYQEVSRQITFFTPGYHGDLLNFTLNASQQITRAEYAKDVMLPVNLLSFSGALSGSNTQLKWQTANEQNMASFNIQRSIDAVNFKNITAIKAKGSGGSYNYSDNIAMLSSGKVYYRLQQVDKNGKITYSSIVFVTLNGRGPAFTILPNPVRNYFSIIPDGTLSISNAFLVVRDMAGNTVLRQKLSNNGEQKVNASSLSKGVYVVSVDAAGSLHSQKIVVE